ncbi:HAMP domain-containing histidine kinase [Vibrio sp. S9_S30]|uniref:sensor histidine kinase n=1 Tax=Vibrio sp. S9_S30 TaxID=2720226 RepID=UPI001680B3B8|nr:HAMP domain-containing sensor histidine kinase [Vibrio sp. S9_S30]MBD1556858.1 HAMP domain-containing histidine kinase [Vibrio sp. S9_S30]
MEKLYKSKVADVKFTDLEQIVPSIHLFDPDFIILYCSDYTFEDIFELTRYARNTLNKLSATIWAVFDGEMKPDSSLPSIDRCFSLKNTPENELTIHFERAIQRHNAINDDQANINNQVNMLMHVERSDITHADDTLFVADMTNAIGQYCNAKISFLFDVSQDPKSPNVYRLKQGALTELDESLKVMLSKSIPLDSTLQHPVINREPSNAIQTLFSGASLLLFPICTYGTLRYNIVCIIDNQQPELINAANLKILEQVSIQLNYSFERRYAIADTNHANEVAQDSSHLPSDNEEQIQSEKMHSLSSIAVGLLHEMNNPISSTLGNFEPLKQYIESILALLALHKQLFIEPHNEQKHETVATFYEETDIDEVLEDIHAVIQDSEAGLLRVKDVLLSLRIFADKALDEKQTPFKLLSVFSDDLFMNPEGIEVTKQIDESLVVVGNRNMVRKVLELVFRNAIEAIDNKGDQDNACIEVTSSSDHQFVRLSIRDNGTGIDEETLNKVFDPFYTNNGKKNASGLGLTIAQFIMQKLRGSIHIESKPNEYTYVTLKMPKA